MQASAAIADLPGAEVGAGRSPPSPYSADSVRLARELVLLLVAQCPEALAVLCRVLWRARGSGLCFASRATLCSDGVSMTLPVLRRGLRWLVDKGLLAEEATLAHGTPVYRPTLERKPRDSVFIPLEVWRWRKPTEIALYAAWAAGGKGLSAVELGARVAGRAGKTLSRSRSFAIFRTLLDAGLIESSGSPKNGRGAVLKSTGVESRKRSANTDSLNSDLLNSGEEKQKPSLLLVPDFEDGGQLEFPFMRHLVPSESAMFIDWLAVTGVEKTDLSEKPRAALAPVREAVSTGALVLPSQDRKPLSPGPGSSPGQPFVNRSFVLAAWNAMRSAAGGAFGLQFPERTDLGVNDGLAMAFTRDAIRLGDAGAKIDDFRTLGEWIAEGYLRWDQERGRPPWRLVCKELAPRMESALAWAAAGRRKLDERRGGVPVPQLSPDDDLEELFEKGSRR